MLRVPVKHMFAVRCCCGLACWLPAPDTLHTSSCERTRALECHSLGFTLQGAGVQATWRLLRGRAHFEQALTRYEISCRFQRGLKRKPLALIKKLRKAKREASSGEKPDPVRTHLRNMIIVPEMIGSIIGVYNGKTFNQVRGVRLGLFWVRCAYGLRQVER